MPRLISPRAVLKVWAVSPRRHGRPRRSRSIQEVRGIYFISGNISSQSSNLRHLIPHRTTKTKCRRASRTSLVIQRTVLRTPLHPDNSSVYHPPLPLSDLDRAPRSTRGTRFIQWETFPPVLRHLSQAHASRTFRKQGIHHRLGHLLQPKRTSSITSTLIRTHKKISTTRRSRMSSLH